MKRFTTPTIPIIFNVDHATIDHIDFIFKLERDMNSQTLFTRRYPDNVSYSETDDIYTIELTAEESGHLPEGIIYMDSRVVTVGDKILNTPIVEIRVSPSLFNSPDKCE